MESEYRELFRTVREAIFSNPFGRTRPELDRLAAGMGKDVAELEVLQALVEKVGFAVEQVAGHEATLAGEDRELLRFGRLFYTFHLFCEDYDEHIRCQVEEGDQCIPVGFAGDVLSMLAGQGFSEREANRFMGLFFQMRRAYYFISSIAGSSSCVMQLRRSLWNNIFTGDIDLYNRYLWDRMEDFSTMILGETGTGKGLAAAAIGRSGFIPYNDRSGRFSESFARAFIPINLSQYPEQLIESELFGHAKGAFTGAVETHRGVFSRCSPCGAIFLDEIGDVDEVVQIKLLQVLQSRSFSPVGSHNSERFEGRVIGATNRNVDQLRRAKRFRDDFYYRLCSDVIEVPSLRRRLDDNPGELAELLGVVVGRITGGQSAELVEMIGEYITSKVPDNYPWPGNIRELEQCARRLLLSGEYRFQTESSTREAEFDKLFGAGKYTARELLTIYSRHLYRRSGSYEGVARIMELDRRTVKKYVQSE